MADNIPMQILSQTSENIQKLFDLSTRIDERVKGSQIHQDNLEEKLDELLKQHSIVLQKIAVIEFKDQKSSVETDVSKSQQEIIDVDKRLCKIENEYGNKTERWKGIIMFVVQLVWVVLAAYILTQLHLQAPAVP